MTKQTARTTLLSALGALLLAAAAPPALADYGPRGVYDLLHSHGYYGIRIVDQDDDEYEVLACRGGWLYELEVDRRGRIEDVDRKGRCGPGYAYRGDVDVHAPYTGVHVGRDGVTVRAPFVDLHVPRRR